MRSQSENKLDLTTKTINLFLIFRAVDLTLSNATNHQKSIELTIVQKRLSGEIDFTLNLHPICSRLFS